MKRFFAFIFILTAQTFSLLDLKRVICMADYPYLQGHGIWHILGGVSMYFTYKHIHQLELD